MMRHIGGRRPIRSRMPAYTRQDPQEDNAPAGSLTDVPLVPIDLQEEIRHVISPWAETSKRPPFNMSQMVTMVLLLGPPCRRVDIMSRIMRYSSHYTHRASAQLLGVARDVEQQDLSGHQNWNEDEDEQEDEDEDADEQDKAWEAQFNQGLESRPDDPGRDLRFALQHFTTPIEVFREDNIAYYYVKPGEGRVYLGALLPTAAALSEKVFPFMKLPAELRERVYKMTLQLPPSGVQIVPPEHGYKTRMRVFSRDYHKEETINLADPRLRNELTIYSAGGLLGLLLTSRAIYKEATSIFYKQNDFVFFGLWQSHRALSRWAPKRRNHVEQISFSWHPGQYGSGEDAAKAFEILGQMPHLRRLDIQVSESTWSARFAILDNKPFTVQRIPGFAAMQKIRGLKTVNFHGDCDNVKEILQPLLVKPLSKAAEKKRKATIKDSEEAGGDVGKTVTKGSGQKRKATEQVSVNARRKTRSIARKEVEAKSD